MRSLACAAVLLAVAPPAMAQSGADSAQQAGVLEVVRLFHSALAAGDSASVVAQLHPAVVIYEGGHAETLSEYRRGHLSSDIAFAAATRRDIAEEAVEVRGEFALYTSQTRTTGRWRDREIDAHGTETVVFVRTPDGWRIRHIHWSSR